LNFPKISPNDEFDKTKFIIPKRTIKKSNTLFYYLKNDSGPLNKKPRAIIFRKDSIANTIVVPISNFFQNNISAPFGFF